MHGSLELVPQNIFHDGKVSEKKNSLCSGFASKEWLENCHGIVMNSTETSEYLNVSPVEPGKAPTKDLSSENFSI